MSDPNISKCNISSSNASNCNPSNCNLSDCNPSTTNASTSTSNCPLRSWIPSQQTCLLVTATALVGGGIYYYISRK